MTIFSVTPNHLARAADTLRGGGLVACPTETVYGLAADATNPLAVARIFEAKGRPRFNPLIAHVRDLEAAERHADFTATAHALAQAFWPGPLTLALPRRADAAVCELACAGLPTIALRAPSHPVMRGLIEAAGVPLAAPSANRSGHVSATTAPHVHDDFGDALGMILDGGPAPLGVESTIVAVDKDRATLLRAGAIERSAIEALVGPLHAHDGAGVQAPGMLASHYAPRARLRLNAAAPRDGELYLAFGAEARAAARNLSPSGDLTEAAANLYAHLRALDAMGAETIAVAPIPQHGLGEAINDRLVRAAAPRA
ncbi:MAG: threonylcarbamoyl-AMP synthase [Alphaproteobacteria bacterium]|nr:threonylcarbamoyl-AMP synthase [Alphaproteobacteria bacterium]